jgi:hypothetical protein
MINSNKKYADIVSYKDSWIFLNVDNESLIVRFNMGIKDAVGHPDYPIRMGIAVPIPGARDHDLIERLEDFIVHHLQNGKCGVHVAVINKLADEKFVEFMCYANEDTNFENFHQMLEAAFPDQEIQMYAGQDPEWQGYISFLDEV